MFLSKKTSSLGASSSTSTNQEEEKEENESWIVSDHYAELFTNMFPSLRRLIKNFGATHFWSELYAIFVEKTTNSPSYKGFPTAKSYKLHKGGGFPTTTRRDRNDPRILKMLTRFIEEHGDDVRDAVTCFINSGQCNLSDYMWKGTPLDSDSYSSSTGGTQSPNNTMSLPRLTEPSTESPSCKKATFLEKRKYNEISQDTDVSFYRRKAVAAIKSDNEKNDLEMTETSILLQEINQALSASEIADFTRREAEFEEEFYEFSKRFFKKKLEIKQEKLAKLNCNIEEVEKLSNELSIFIGKRHKKLREQEEKEHDLVKAELQKLLDE